MATLPEGKQRLGIGCYYTMKPANSGLAIDANLVIKWYGWPFLMWKYVTKEYTYKWYQYPVVILNIILLSIKKWMRAGHD